MGAFYGSIHIRTDEVETVRGALANIAKRKWKFLVSPVMDGWIAAYPNVNGQDERVSKALAKKLDWPILHVAVHLVASHPSSSPPAHTTHAGTRTYSTPSLLPSPCSSHVTRNARSTSLTVDNFAK